MKYIITSSIIAFALVGCSTSSTNISVKTDLKKQKVECAGDINIPDNLKGSFREIKDDELLKRALGEPLKGKLCKAKVFKITQDTTLYRAWNSTNPNSKLGKWWAFDTPKGKTFNYRSDYEICYEWSPIDKMSHCIIKADTKVVIGTGQSAKCSPYVIYDVSEKNQIYIENASSFSAQCKTYDNIFSWKESK